MFSARYKYIEINSMARNKITSPVHKRTPDERERDLVIIAERILHGVAQAAIAKELGISQSQISYDLAEIRERWQAQANEAHGALVAQQLAEVREVKKSAWAAWENSRKPKRKSEAAIKGASGNATTEKRTSEEQRDGNPTFLDLVVKAMEKEARLMGLDKPTAITAMVRTVTLQTNLNEE